MYKQMYHYKNQHCTAFYDTMQNSGHIFSTKGITELEAVQKKMWSRVKETEVSHTERNWKGKNLYLTWEE